ncbi:hypothetical protein POKO110462_21335 [Pontibacter korlensis]|uniref:Secretion system C-terminal sorting domain-containing protein n=1 Tax=Pontibacter korlensis TaxID=400092 RepID=A0A0E3ZJB4_9BACT|nr:hypothetical protein [Pontibacter korlensis]AKD05123.1 hypothetical protein PKOR_21155 [Pontibacter korlensis]
MKTKQKYTLALAMSLPVFSLASIASIAQHTALPAQSKEHILVIAEDGDTHIETLSGIHMRPTSKGTFQLDFSQELDENAMLEIKNSAGKLVYQKPVSIEGNRTAWRYQLGKLKPDTYLIEVKTSDTTYWTKFKVSR